MFAFPNVSKCFSFSPNVSDCKCFSLLERWCLWWRNDSCDDVDDDNNDGYEEAFSEAAIRGNDAAASTITSYTSWPTTQNNTWMTMISSISFYLSIVSIFFNSWFQLILFKEFLLHSPIHFANQYLGLFKTEHIIPIQPTRSWYTWKTGSFSPKSTFLAFKKSCTSCPNSG